jgi:hypothetical protein
MPAVAADAQGDAAVIFTEWRDRKQLLRIATRTSGDWQVATLDERTQTIWSPSVVITPNGTTLATWIDETAPTRRICAAVLPRDGNWRKPVTLESGDGLGTVALGVGRGNAVVFAWHDGIAGESRVRVASFVGGSWSRLATIEETLERVDHVTLTGPNATILRWRHVSLTDENVEHFEARRDGTRWTVVPVRNARHEATDAWRP